MYSPAVCKHFRTFIISKPSVSKLILLWRKLISRRLWGFISDFLILQFMELGNKTTHTQSHLPKFIQEARIFNVLICLPHYHQNSIYRGRTLNIIFKVSFFTCSYTRPYPSSLEHTEWLMGSDMAEPVDPICRACT